jgi:hypothetical protein
VHNWVSRRPYSPDAFCMKQISQNWAPFRKLIEEVCQIAEGGNRCTVAGLGGGERDIYVK